MRPTPGYFRKEKINVNLTGRLEIDSASYGPVITGPLLILHHEMNFLGKQYSFYFEENNKKSVTIRIKDEFLRKYKDCFSPLAELYTFVRCKPGNTDGALLIFGVKNEDVINRPRNLEEIAVPFHIAASMAETVKKPLNKLLIQDFIQTYQVIRNTYSLSAHYREDSAYNYTVMSLDRLTNHSLNLSVNIPFGEAV